VQYLFVCFAAAWSLNYEIIKAEIVVKCIYFFCPCVKLAVGEVNWHFINDSFFYSTVAYFYFLLLITVLLQCVALVYHFFPLLSRLETKMLHFFRENYHHLASRLRLFW
jgi:hypothetical protein